MSDDDWFAPKKFGYGAGLPIAWQGWVALIGYTIAVIIVAAVLAPHHPLIAAGIILPATIAFLVLCAQHTRGGWKWRWKGEE